MAAIFTILALLITLISTTIGMNLTADSTSFPPQSFVCSPNPTDYIGGPGICECYDDAFGVDRAFMITAIHNACLYFSNYLFGPADTLSATYAYYCESSVLVQSETSANSCGIRLYHGRCRGRHHHGLPRLLCKCQWDGREMYREYADLVGI